ncbi:hypothetical protein ILUMI_19614 [Ignelater luminosus]|uniref:Uncharacterized protein n=1 Tax=Ignelater luminosus TaxID=2038154 RepID=A0A8K0G5B5_IGNLU|nr:hypothetical protein ILUMI_19614 [Ignelater luminosus]
MDIAEVSWYNKSCLKSFEVAFVPYNRTQRVANSTIELLFDAGSDVILDVQFYKMMSNEYRFFPLTFSANICAEYMRNTCGLKDFAIKASNMNPCRLHKGKYYVHNVMPDFSRFPPHMPRGSYKVVSELSFHSIRCAQVDYYARVVDKPIDWKNIPKSSKYN